MYGSRERTPPDKIINLAPLQTYSNTYHMKARVVLRSFVYFFHPFISTETDHHITKISFLHRKSYVDGLLSLALCKISNDKNETFSKTAGRYGLQNA
jgi:hypothetical protein